MIKIHSIAMWIVLLSLSVMGIALLESSRRSWSVFTKLKLLSHGYLSYELGDNWVFVGTKEKDCPDRIFRTFNYGRPVYSKGNMVGCITKIGWFTPVGVNNGRQMLESERSFIVTLTWIETLAFAFGLVSAVALMCILINPQSKKIPRFVTTALVFVLALDIISIALGAYGISSFKHAKWVPFHPDYGKSMLSFMSSFRVPPTGLLKFWDNWALPLWCGVAVILAGTLLLSLKNKKWLAALWTSLACSVCVAMCGFWIWQSSMMNWYEMWTI